MKQIRGYLRKKPFLCILWISQLLFVPCSPNTGWPQFGSVSGVPVPLWVPGKTAPTVPVSGSCSVLDPPCKSKKMCIGCAHFCIGVCMHTCCPVLWGGGGSVCVQAIIVSILDGSCTLTMFRKEGHFEGLRVEQPTCAKVVILDTCCK